MRIDVHTHIFPPEIVQNRSSFFAGEPAFELLYSSAKAKLVTGKMLVDAMDEEEIDRSVVFGFPWRNGEWACWNNDYVLEMAARYSPRLIPLACVHPLEKEAPKEAQRCFQNGVKGLGELAIYDPCGEKTALQHFQDLVDCTRSYRGILLVHANEPIGHSYPGKASLGLSFYYDLARMAAEIPLILAHWGGGLCFYELLKKEAGEILKNVTYDTAASPFLYRPEIYTLMSKALGPHKILMGSDYPLLPPKRYVREMEESGLDEESKRAILGENAARLFFSSTDSD